MCRNRRRMARASCLTWLLVAACGERATSEVKIENVSDATTEAVNAVVKMRSEGATAHAEMRDIAAACAALDAERL